MKQKAPPSAFLQAAQRLDDLFTTMEGLGRSMNALELPSEGGLDKARGLLQRYQQETQNLQTGLTSLMEALEERRLRVTDSLEPFERRAEEMAETARHQTDLLTRLQTLGENVRQINLRASTSPREELVAGLGDLKARASSLQEDARQAKYRTVEREAQRMAESLGAMQRKLGG